ncbi:MAG: family 43 glycosylhydrolase [Lachnospirales bacterium]
MSESIEYNKYNVPFIPKRADPYLYKDTKGDYYFTASVPSYDKIILRKAQTIKDIANAKEKVIWNKHNSGDMSIHIWAPEIHFVFGKWYIYFAAGDVQDVWKIRPYVLECQGENPMEDTWIEKGKMQCSDDDEFSFRAFSLDATIFKNRNEYYYVWAEKVGVGKAISNLYIAKMESAVKLKTVQVMLTTPDYNWERVGFWVNEGPAILKKDGKIFLTYSASATGACYCMGMLIADEKDDLLDPLSWVKSRKPVLESDQEKEVYGPGHNSFVKSEDGLKDIMIYHARPYEKIEGNPLYDYNRNALLMEVKWKNDMPFFEFNEM